MSDTETPELTLHEKFAALEDKLNSELVERRTEIYCMLLADIAATTFFMLGPPGTAKSFLPARKAKYVSGVNYFDILMTRFTQPEEIFGPPSLKALENDQFLHIIDGYLPWADAAMVDEIFKAGSSILNAFLWIINERKYRHGSDVISVPLTAFYCASNELPSDNSLNALYDRLLFRFEVQPVSDTSSFLKMMSTKLDPNPTPIMSWADVRQAQEEAADVEIPDRVYEALADIRAEFAKKDIRPSERRFVESLKIVRAAAWLDECPKADTDHLTPLEHVFWDVPGQRGEVSRIVLEKANPLEVEANALLTGIKELNDSIDAVSSDDERMRLGNEVHTKLNEATDELRDLKARAGTGKRRSVKVAEVKDALSKVTDRVLTEIFSFSPEDAEALKARRQLEAP